MKPQNATDEKDLLQKLRDGDETAFVQVYHRYNRRLIANLLGMLKSPDLVEETMQELFLKLWEHRKRIDPEQSIQAYLFKIARHLVYDLFRKAQRDRQLYSELLCSFEENYSHIEEGILREEQRVQLQKAIDSMPPQQRKVYRLCKLEQKTYEEVSQLLHISTGTVNVHIRKANAFLKNYFASKPALVITFALQLLMSGL